MRGNRPGKPPGKLQSALAASWNTTPPANDPDGFQDFEEFRDFA
jgi:hypothetical protein